jgi:hypothetical protein
MHSLILASSKALREMSGFYDVKKIATIEKTARVSRHHVRAPTICHCGRDEPRHSKSYNRLAVVCRSEKQDPSAAVWTMSIEGTVQKLGQLPPEMLDFTLLKTTGALAPRLGRLSLPGRKSLLTPAFIGNTSRGVIPHISQDNFAKSVDLNGVYVALEDCKLP